MWTIFSSIAIALVIFVALAPLIFAAAGMILLKVGKFHGF
jgi:hypothetical protein